MTDCCHLTYDKIVSQIQQNQLNEIKGVFSNT
jgi:hypothetical protein